MHVNSKYQRAFKTYESTAVDKSLKFNCVNQTTNPLKVSHSTESCLILTLVIYKAGTWLKSKVFVLWQSNVSY